MDPTQAYPLVPLSLCEVGGESQFGNKAESLADSEVRKEAIVLADMSDAFLHELRRVGLAVN